MNFIDLFSGAGGLSEGFIKAGFNPIAHVEIDSNACQTLETRLIFHKLQRENQLNFYYDYLLEKISREDFLLKYSNKEISNSVINTAIGGENNKEIFNIINKLVGARSIDLIVGGPPCQAYSLIGRARDKNKMKDDSRNYLYKEYAKFLKEYRPKVFVFENVLGLITANEGKFFKNMKSYFKRIGYELDYSIETSSDYGVLQKRKRIILIGWRKDVDFEFPTFDKVTNDWTVTDLLTDLKKLKPGEQNKITKYKTDTTNYLSKFDLRNGVDFVTQHIARPHNHRDLEIYKIAIKKFEKGERLKYPDLPERLKTHKNQKSFVDRYKVVDSEGLSHTMVAHIAKDGHHYIYPDKKQVRSLSVREAARIQSFPDDFFFEGGRTSAFKQIGNAVPPLMAKEIANKIHEQLINE
ncbi:DNA (cytosine-5)-methyltransferase 1 [Tenacibaculum adriaticum]|uniref:Cytosine-specific methyltransferase n=1 Tax=Tenacibaculum adriaticum TaxID=413713 RepID=A0A5S5DQ02_9FLAO|nr:DNA cytosine methyltransferase [Tenacibaculum adriaticum]TYP97458.1 DNA (cytosine-5)-methyltransferase 1 [Tenacibaculum adriaticum]